MTDYNDRQNAKVVGEVITTAFSSITDSVIDVHSAVKVLAITVTAELGVLTMVLFAREKLSESLADQGDNFWIYGSVAVFVNGFLIAFALHRLIIQRWPYAGAYLAIWVVSAFAGVANFFLFFVLLTNQFR